MKKYIYGLLAVLSVAAISSCSEKEGSEPGNDSNPYLFCSSCGLGENYDPDCDVAVRFAVNDATSSVYYLSEKTSDYEARLKSLGEAGYAEYVKNNGTQLNSSVGTGTTGDSIYETTISGLYGEFTIVGVAFGKSSKFDLKTTTFSGELWSDVVAGTYVLIDDADLVKVMDWGGRNKATTLQVSSMDSNKYRFKNLYGKNSHLYFTLNGKDGTDDNGHYRNFSMPAHATPGNFGKYGTMFIRDVATWQGDASLEDDNRLYDDNWVSAFVEYYVSDGYIVYGYDAFKPE